MRTWWIWLTCVLVVSAAHAQEVGPKRGALVIVGGAMKDTAIMERFIELAGGPTAPIVVIPTAGGDDDYDDFYRGARGWRKMGVTRERHGHPHQRSQRGGLRRVCCAHPQGARRLVSGRASVAARGFLLGHAHGARASRAAGARWCHWWLFCWSDDSRIVPRAR